MSMFVCVFVTGRNIDGVMNSKEGDRGRHEELGVEMMQIQYTHVKNPQTKIKIKTYSNIPLRT